jgi:heptosyltransferase-2
MLRETYSGALVYVLVSNGNKKLLEADPSVYKVIKVPSSGIRKAMKLVGRLMSEDFDLVIDPFITHSLKSALLARIVGNKYRCGFAQAGRERLFNVISPIADLRVNMVDSMHTLARQLGYSGRDETKRLEGCIMMSEPERADAQSRFDESGLLPGEPVLGIHPGGRYETQRWPLEKFLRVGIEVRKRENVKVVLFQERMWRRGLELNGLLPEGIVMMGESELVHFVAAVERVSLLLCNNSGPLHVARALDVPTISVTGPTRQAFLPEVARIHSMIGTPIDCRPCDKPVCHHHTCLLSVQVEDVVDMISKMLRKLMITSGKITQPHTSANLRMK